MRGPRQSPHSWIWALACALVLAASPARAQLPPRANSDADPVPVVAAARSPEAGVDAAEFADADASLAIPQSASENLDLTLPPVSPTEQNPAIAESPQAPTAPLPPAERPRFVIKTILGLVALLALAYIGGHPRVQKLERVLGITQVITAGFPFVALGLLARLPGADILTDPVLADLGPLLRFGLGWIGFIIGFRFDARVVAAAAHGVAPFVAIRALTTFAVIVVASAAVLGGSAPVSLSDPVFVRDALILGTAGSLTSLAAPQLLAARGGTASAVDQVASVVRIEEITGVVGLLFIAAYFRPHGTDVTWQLPGTAWLLLTIGLGAAIGLLVYAILLRTSTNRAEAMVLILGSVAFAAGMAAQLRLSPVVVCFVAGLLLVNFPSGFARHVEQTLKHLERPIYLVFLVVVGALWEVRDWRGWLLMAVFVAARFLGKWLGVRFGEKQSGLTLEADARKSLVLAPMGALSIAIVLGSQVLYPGGSISRIVTAIVGGAIVTEILVQALTRASVRNQSPRADEGRS